MSIRIVGGDKVIMYIEMHPLTGNVGMFPTVRGFRELEFS